MFTTVADFLTTWRHESAQTGRLLAELTDASLGQRIAPGYRSLGELAWHIVVSPRVILRKAGLEFPAPERDAPVPASATAIRERYVAAARELGNAVEREWSDLMLGEGVPFYGTLAPRGRALAVMLHHEIHHRGQLTVLMRQAGLRVPGVYGPSKDDSA